MATTFITKLKSFVRKSTKRHLYKAGKDEVTGSFVSYPNVFSTHDRSQHAALVPHLVNGKGDNF
jgi:hypothetical protein